MFAAEDRGFEPLRAVNPTRIPSVRHRPLGESSVRNYTGSQTSVGPFDRDRWSIGVTHVNRCCRPGRRGPHRTARPAFSNPSRPPPCNACMEAVRASSGSSGRGPLPSSASAQRCPVLASASLGAIGTIPAGSRSPADDQCPASDRLHRQLRRNAPKTSCYHSTNSIGYYDVHIRGVVITLGGDRVSPGSPTRYQAS